MKKAILTIILLALTICSFGQRKVWNNDKRPVYKGDTSIVIIKDQAYQKIVGVNYKLISEEILQNEFVQARDEIREQRRRLNQQMRRDSIALVKLEAELDMRRSFYRLARKELKFATKEAGDISDKKRQEQKKSEQRQRLIESSVIQNPRKKN